MTPTAQAGLSVSPARVVLQAKPEQTRVGFFALANRGDAPLDVTVEAEDWREGITGARGRVDWLTVKPTKLRLRPGKSAKVKYVVRVPNTASGELRTQVFFTTRETAEGIVSLRSRLGAIVYVGIEGTEQIEAAITTLDATYTASTPGIAQPDQLDVAIGIQNRGNAHIVPEGEVGLRDEDGQSVATISFPAGWGLLPNQQETYRATGHGIHLKPGQYTVDVTVHCGSDLHHPTTVTKTLKAEVTQEGTWRFLEPAPASP